MGLQTKVVSDLALRTAITILGRWRIAGWISQRCSVWRGSAEFNSPWPYINIEESRAPDLKLATRRLYAPTTLACKPMPRSACVARKTQSESGRSSTLRLELQRDTCTGRFGHRFAEHNCSQGYYASGELHSGASTCLCGATHHHCPSRALARRSINRSTQRCRTSLNLR